MYQHLFCCFASVTYTNKLKHYMRQLGNVLYDKLHTFLIDTLYNVANVASDKHETSNKLPSRKSLSIFFSILCGICCAVVWFVDDDVVNVNFVITGICDALSGQKCANVYSLLEC